MSSNNVTLHRNADGDVERAVVPLSLTADERVLLMMHLCIASCRLERGSKPLRHLEDAMWLLGGHFRKDGSAHLSGTLDAATYYLEAESSVAIIGGAMEALHEHVVTTMPADPSEFRCAYELAQRVHGEAIRVQTALDEAVGGHRTAD